MRASIERGWEMREIKVKRDELLETIRKNRTAHIIDYKEACDGYRGKALQRIDEIVGNLRGKINALKEGETIALMSVSFGLDVPVSHERDYDQVIKMLEMSVDDEISLKSDEFACYVMDDWDWKQVFLASNARYK